jgi:PRTRC genetic system ThiF family protein
MESLWFRNGSEFRTHSAESRTRPFLNRTRIGEQCSIIASTSFFPLHSDSFRPPAGEPSGADIVSETNCVRQPFSASDIGQNKATELINRINMFWGTKWSAEPSFFNERTLHRSYDEVPDLLIGCVDTRAARKVIDQAVTRPMQATTYWLDIGKNASSGQYVLGQPLNSRNRRAAVRLRTVSELYPEIVDAAAGEDPLPSCSAIEALDRQEPFINQTLASSALAMLARLFRHGS